MISRQVVFEIHRLRDEGYSNRKIAHILQINRNTVNEYSKNPERAVMPKKKRTSKLDPFKASISGYLEKDPLVSAPVVYRKIKQDGYTGAITILRDYLKKTRGQSKFKKAFIRFESPPGEQFQIDWGHFGSIDYNGTKRKLYALAVIESYSRMLYIEFTHSQKQQTLHGCLLNAFKFFSGTPKQVVVDNMLTAVTQRQGRLIRFNDAFLDFLRPFHIVPRACNISAAYEKGKIESAIKYLRRNFFPLREYADLTDIQTQVLDWLDQTANVRVHQTTGEVPRERFQPAQMRPLPPLINMPLETENPLVHKDFSIKFDSNSYTTPFWTIGKKLTLRADQHTLWIYHKEKLICSYPRCWERKRRIETPSHVQQVKRLKRHQLENREMTLFASLGEEYRRFMEKLPQSGGSIKKQIVRLLNLKDQYGIKSLSWAIMKALHHNAYGADYVENILYQEMTPINQHPPVQLKNETLNRIRLSEPTLKDYDAYALKRRKKQ